ncbi:MAG TPA: lipoyl synthase, partial [Gemmatimonadota bacterium]|nr:lipoyl synthase [Gemmatimonadota bacterium]
MTTTIPLDAVDTGRARPRKPEWLKVRAGGGPRYASVKHAVEERGLHTVCQEARCPNIGECWGHG